MVRCGNRSHRLLSERLAVSIVYELGPFRLDPEAGVLTHAGLPTPLGERGVAVLTALVKMPNEYVRKASILDAAWPGVVVEENSLAAQISAIRRVLAKAPGGEHWVETLTRRGYRFVGPVSELRGSVPRGETDGRPRSNLPEPLTSFVGRERELVEIKRLLPSSRLLTVVGVGGIGKTRFALQVGSEVMDAYRDGVWLVEFASIADASLVPTSVAQVLGVHEKSGTPLAHMLCAYLKSRKLLLIFDNCEHLHDACATLADAILRAAKEPTIIATSREPLHVAGEQTYPLPALSLPDPTASVQMMGNSEAVQLFVERARKQQPGFEFTGGRASAVAQLCIHLDGIPMALELAAARVRSLTIEEINARLGDRFKLLTGGTRTALPRQQTLRATLDWSYDLLREAENALFARLSVFVGGWTLEAAENVCVGENIEVWEVLDLLTALADKNLVVAEERNGATRYRLLETVRQYARDRLRERGEDAHWEGRHLAYFLALAEEAEPQLTGANQLVWLDRLEAEHDNLRAALAWSSALGGDIAGGLQLAGALCRFWFVRGHLREGRDWLAGVLAAAPSGQLAAARAKALHGAGGLALQQTDYPAAWALSGESLAIRRNLGDKRGIATSLISVANVALMQRDFQSARALYEESVALFRELGNQWGIAVSLNNLGIMAHEQSDYLSARALHSESLTIRRQLGDRWGIAGSLNNLGTVARGQGDYTSARAFHSESLAIRAELGDQSSIADSLEGLADVELALARPNRAARIWGRAERLREEVPLPLTPMDRARYERSVAAARAAMGADVAFDLAWQEGRGMTLKQAIEYALKGTDA